MISTKRTIQAIALGIVGALVVAVPASAHITMSPSTTEAGGYAFTRVNVSHGCDDAGTTKVTIQIPQDDWVFTSVTPFVHPDWTPEVVTGKLKEPAEVHGSKVTEGVTEVVFTKNEGALDAHMGDALHVSIRLPEDAAGETIYFPIVQECEGGKESAWIQIPAEGEDGHDLELPATSITVTEAGGHGHGAKASDDEEDDNDAAASSDDDDAVSDESKLALGLGGGALLLSLIALVRSGRGRRG